MLGEQLDERTPLPIPSKVHHKPDLILRLELGHVLAVALLVLICATRLIDLRYNTLFIDEAAYALVGRDLLGGAFDPQTLTWLSGSYLYPLLAALVEHGGDVLALRGLSVALSTLTAALIYIATARLFDQAAGRWALLLFGLSGISIFVGQFGVMEALAGLLLAASVSLLVRAAVTAGPRGWWMLLGASLCFGLAALTKYVLVVYFPALAMLLLMLGFSKAYQAPPRSAWAHSTALLVGLALLLLVGPAGALLAAYSLANYAELQQLLSGSATFQAGTAPEIFWALWQEIGLVLVLAGLAGLFALRWLLRNQAIAPLMRAGWLMLGLLFGVALLALPLYQAATGNARSAGKHAFYTLLWLAPLAGYACERLRTAVRRYQHKGVRLLGATAGLFAIIGAMLACTHAFDRVWVWQNSWPDATPALTALRAAELPQDARVLAEASDIYAYHLGPQASRHARWFSTWGFSYGDQTDVAAMAAAISDHYFTAVVFDDYYNPGIRAKLLPVLEAAGYRQILATSQQLSSGAIIETTMYLRPEEGAGGPELSERL